MTKSFLQSQEWEEFQKAIGRKVWRVGDALIIKFPLTFGKSYLYCAGSRTLPSLENIRSIAKQENAIFFKFEPLCGGSHPPHLEHIGFRKSRKEIQPQKTVVLDITGSEKQLLFQMHSKTRYNIRLAEKKGVKILNSRNAFEKFWELMQKTAQRDRFSSHPKEYYEKLLASPFAKMFVSEHENKTIAANILIFYGERAIYLHGASDYNYRNLMAPYLLHWEIIKYAKAQGFKEYDLWGIDEKKWPGVTRFKKGFGGEEVEYIGSYDYIFQPLWHKAYKFWDLAKKFLKN